MESSELYGEDVFLITEFLPVFLPTSTGLLFAFPGLSVTLFFSRELIKMTGDLEFPSLQGRGLGDKEWKFRSAKSLGLRSEASS